MVKFLNGDKQLHFKFVLIFFFKANNMKVDTRPFLSKGEERKKVKLDMELQSNV